jgi:hypothetical protein
VWIRLSFAIPSYFRNLNSGINRNTVRCAGVNKKPISGKPYKDEKDDYSIIEKSCGCQGRYLGPGKYRGDSYFISN